ncbi:MAG: TonB family protein, partial [Myxococcaceae bacterium]|nr:TonB family protein [Myxococcaceae bacterium]
MLWLALALSLTGLTRPPELLAQPDAVYPADAADAGVQGTVVLEIDIGPDGKVIEARVTGKSGTDSFD